MPPMIASKSKEEDQILLLLFMVPSSLFMAPVPPSQPCSQTDPTRLTRTPSAMFLLPRKRRSAGSDTEAATPNQRVRPNPPEPSLTPVDAVSCIQVGPDVPGERVGIPTVDLNQGMTQEPFDRPRQWNRAPADEIIVDGKRVFPCRVCGFQFSANSNRSRHERNKHPELAAMNPSAHMQGQALVSGPENNQLCLSSNLSAVALSLEDPLAMQENLEATKMSESHTTHRQMSVTSHQETPSIGAPVQRSDEETSADAADAGALLPGSPFEPLGALALLHDTQLQSECMPFLRWMCTPPITQVEALVKARRITSMTQLQPIKLNLRFLFGLLLEAQAIEELELQSLTRLAVCQSLQSCLESRQVGHGRVHAMFLLVKKVLVFLSSQESTRRHQFLPPTMHESYMFVENVCSDSSHRRKQEARNRAVLGMQLSKKLHAANSRSGPRSSSILSADAFAMPSMLGAAVPSTTITTTTSAAAAPTPVTYSPLQIQPNSTSSSSASSSSNEEEQPSPNELTSEELKVVAKGSLAYLRQSRTDDDSALAAIIPSYYVHHLVTATLCLGLAPRSQVLKQLRIGSSFVKEADGRYWVKMLAELNKNGRPTTFALPKELTEPFDYYLTTLRPRLLRERGQEHDFVFFKRNGTAPRADFSELTTVATQQLIQRPVNPHAFRSAVITTFYSTGATQSAMDVLSTIMAHSSATARSVYFKPQMAKAAVDTNDRMLQALDLAPDSQTE